MIHPEDEIIFGWQYPVDADTCDVHDVGASDVPFYTMTLFDNAQITLYGSLVKDNKEFMLIMVAQNGQFIPHPACEEIQTVVRSVYRIRTDSTHTPSCKRHKSFLVLPPSQLIERTKVINFGKNASANLACSSFGISVKLSTSSL